MSSTSENFRAHQPMVNLFINTLKGAAGAESKPALGRKSRQSPAWCRRTNRWTVNGQLVLFTACWRLGPRWYYLCNNNFCFEWRSTRKINFDFSPWVASRTSFFWCLEWRDIYNRCAVSERARLFLCSPAPKEEAALLFVLSPNTIDNKAAGLQIIAPRYHSH